jgi:hypothetical protein
MADCLTPEADRLLSNTSNTAAYAAILRVLERRGMRATFAFVGAFTLHPDELSVWRHYLPEEHVRGRPWLEAFFIAERQRRFDGWLNPDPLKLVRAAGSHEIGIHGFSHLPLAESVAAASAFDRELGAACALARARGDTIQTLVYPRNQLGHVSRLLAHGLLGYRDSVYPAWRGSSRRAANILREFNLIEPSEPHSGICPVVAIPAGHILNFHHSFARRIVPRAATRCRWRNMLEHAAKNGGVAHLWSHPHNFLSDPGLIDEFDSIMEYASRLVEDGRLINSTLGEYSRSVIGSK